MCKRERGRERKNEEERIKTICLVDRLNGGGKKLR